MSIPFVRDMEVDYEAVKQLTPLVRRLIAHNPGPFTFHGTGTYIIGHGQIAIIDPGPDDELHINALLNAVRGETVTHILVTHTHCDHSSAAKAIKQSTGAPTFAFSAHGGERIAAGVEEGADFDFQPDQKMSDGDRVSGPNWTLEAVHTPGHTANHLCFDLNEEATLFSGDHVMGWSTTVIAPPDGNMADYLASLYNLLKRNDRLYRPTHGPAITNPKPLVNAYIDHRAQRSMQVQQRLNNGCDNIDEIVKSIYADHDSRLHRAAGHSVLAHLIAMIDDGSVRCDDPKPTLESSFTSVN